MKDDKIIAVSFDEGIVKVGVFRQDLKCNICKKVGSYDADNDGIGLCKTCIINNFDMAFSVVGEIREEKKPIIEESKIDYIE
jgi:hypothetical protein